MFLDLLTFFIHITPVATKQFYIYEIPKWGVDKVK